MSDDFTPGPDWTAGIAPERDGYEQLDHWTGDELESWYRPLAPALQLPTAPGTVIRITGQWWLLDEDGQWKRGTSAWAPDDLVERLGVTEFTLVALPVAA